MGRKNRKGRTPRQRPRRRYVERRSAERDESRHRRRSDGAGGEAGRRDLSMPAPAGPLALEPDPWSSDAFVPDRLQRLRDLPPVRSEASAGPVCGRCQEFVPPPDALAVGGRGRCLHPASGVAFPPAEMSGCPYFHR